MMTQLVKFRRKNVKLSFYYMYYFNVKQTLTLIIHIKMEAQSLGQLLSQLYPKLTPRLTEFKIQFQAEPLEALV